MFRLHRMAQSAMSADLLLACSLANAACAVANVMATLIFVIHHCLSVACILSHCCCPLIPPCAHGSCGNLSFPTLAIHRQACVCTGELWQSSSSVLPKMNGSLRENKIPLKNYAPGRQHCVVWSRRSCGNGQWQEVAPTLSLSLSLSRVSNPYF